MRKSGRKVTYIPLSPEKALKIIHAEKAVAKQEERAIRCPYCNWKSILAYTDASGHIKFKCRNCGNEIVVRLDKE